MSPSTWSATSPLDLDADTFPPALEALFARPAATVPAVLLVVSPGARRDGWASRAAVAIAGGWSARGGDILLTDLSLDDPELHGRVGLDNDEGIADVIEFGLSLGRVAKDVPSGGFRLISAGAYVPDTAWLLSDPAWERLIVQCAGAGRTLLLYAPSDLAGIDALARRVGKAILLSGSTEVESIAAGLPAACSILLVLEAPVALVPAPTDAGLEAGGDPPLGGQGLESAIDLASDPETATTAPGEPSDDPDPVLMEPVFIRREPTRRRRISPVLWVLLLAALAAAGWFGAATYLKPRLADGDAVEPAPSRPAPPAPGPIAEVPLPYSVAVETHPHFGTALERVAALRAAEPGIAFFIAPVQVDGVVYHHVLAGLAQDTAVAGALMRHLVEGGHKTEPDSWAIRPTAWAYHLGDFRSLAEAEAREEELLAKGVPSYIVDLSGEGGAGNFRLYAGAYEGPAQGEVMARLLAEAGEEPRLIRRTGRPVE